MSTLDYNALDALLDLEVVPMLRQVVSDIDAPAAARVQAGRSLIELAGRMRPERHDMAHDRPLHELSADELAIKAADIDRQMAEWRAMIIDVGSTPIAQAIATQPRRGRPRK